jgi:hypothetical protein
MKYVAMAVCEDNHELHSMLLSYFPIEVAIDNDHEENTSEDGTFY